MDKWDSHKLLDKYIHDYMKRKNMHETAEIFAQEANIGDRAVAIESPEGFLTEWWSLFWEFYCSRLAKANAARAGESSSEAVAATGNVPQDFHPIIPRPPMSQQSIGNMQPHPCASLPRPELMQQAMNAMQTPFPILPRPEMIQHAMNAMQIPFPVLPRPEMNQQDMNEMQTPFPVLQAMNAMQAPFPVLPRQEMNQQAMNEMQTPFPIQQANEMQAPFPVLPRQEMNQQAMNDLQTPFPTLARPEMNQQVMNAMQTAMQTPFPLLARSEMNQQIMSGMPMSYPDVSANFPASPGFGVHHGEIPTLFGKIYEQEYLKRSARDLATNFELLDVEKMNQMLPSSSYSRRQLQISDEIQRQNTLEEIQQKIARDGRCGIIIETSKAAVPIPQGGPQATPEETEGSDAGKGKSIQQIPVQDHLLTGVGSFSLGTMQRVLNSTVPVTNQKQQILAFEGHYQQYHLAKPDEQDSGMLTGSSWNLPSPMLIDDDLNGMVLHLPGNAQIGNGIAVQQQTGIPISKETVVPKKQQTPKLKQHKSNESCRKRKNSSNVLPVQSTLDEKNAEVQKSMDEDFRNDMGTHFSTFQQNLPALNESAWKGFSFRELGSLHSPDNKLMCCHFTSMGKLLAGAGYDKKIMIWNMESLSVDVIDGHSDIITDVRFRPNSTVFATSSFDKTLQIWDASQPTRHPSKLSGHSEHVMSLDFHPKKGDLLCSCDSSNEMRIWNVTQQACMHHCQGASKQVRFQPRHGDFLASATGNIINLIDAETNVIVYQFKGHDKDVRSLCWDTSGTYIASVSEDSARIWTINLGGRCIHELQCSGSKFESCTFRPGYSQLMVIGTYQKLELWNPTDSDRTWSYHAHDGIIAALADSPHTETIASASHDNWLKLWK